MASLIAAGGLSAAALRPGRRQFVLQMGSAAPSASSAAGRCSWFMRAGAAAQRGPLSAADAGLRAGALRRWPPSRTAPGSWPCSSRASCRRRAGAVQARDRAVPLRAGQPRRDRRVRRPRPHHRPADAGPAPTSGCPGWCSASLLAVRHPPAAGRAVPAARPGWTATSAPSCCSPGSRAPCRSCSAASCSPRTSPDAERLYGIVVVVVIFSVLVQGSLVPARGAAARAADAHGRTASRGRSAYGCATSPAACTGSPSGPASPADGRTIGDLADLPGDAWVSFVVRDGQLVPIRADTVLRSGDEVLVLADPALHRQLAAVFEGP